MRQVRSETYWKRCVKELSFTFITIKFTQDFLIIKNAGLCDNIHIFFMNLSFQILQLMLHIVTKSASLAAVTYIATIWTIHLSDFWLLLTNHFFKKTNVCTNKETRKSTYKDIYERNRVLKHTMAIQNTSQIIIKHGKRGKTGHAKHGIPICKQKPFLRALIH